MSRRPQTGQVLANLHVAVTAADLIHIIRWNIQVIDGRPLQAGLEALRRQSGDSAPPAVAVVVFGALAPHFLVEIDAIAVLPAEPPEARRSTHHGLRYGPNMGLLLFY